jgi:two-component system, LuxR family, sensor kinase FixL
MNMDSAVDTSAAPNFQALFAALPHAYLVFTPELSIVEASDAYLRATNSRRENILGRNVFDVFPENPRAPRSSATAARSSIEIAIETRRPHSLWRQRYDIPQSTEQGESYDERYWNVSNHPILDRAGVLLWIVQSVDDVTDEVRRSRADQERLRSAEEHFAATFEQEGVGIVDIAIDGRILDANVRFCKLIGLGLDELRARTIHEITHPDDLPASMRLAEALVNGDVPHYSIEKRYVRPDGAPLWVSTSRSLVRAAHGRPAYFVAVVEDISTQKAAETALREREAYLRSILDTIPDAMIVIDDGGIIQSFSRAAEDLFGYAADEVLGRKVEVLMTSEDSGRHDSYIQRYLDTNTPRIIGIGRVVLGRRKDASTFSLRLWVGEIRTEHNTRMFVGFIRDLTERQQAEARLQELQSELVHVSRFTALGEMASALAHELNQPLTAATNYLKGARRILDQGVDDRLPLLNHAVEEAAAQTLRAGQIIRRLRDFVSRRESDRSAEDVRNLVKDASALALVGAAERGVRVAFDFDPAVSTVYADPVQIQQVLVNLIRNAIEAMHEAARRELTIATRGNPDGMIEISVCDTGPGLAPEVAAHLFQPFITTKPTGMGVGLSICRTIIEAHEGEIAATKNLDGGATFRFTLRAVPAEEPADA